MDDPSAVPTGMAVVVADERQEPLEEAIRLVEAAGHRVVASDTDLEHVAGLIAQHRAELAVIAVHETAEHVLALLERINDAAPCPTVLLFDDEDAELLHNALERGLDAYAGRSAASLNTAIVFALRRSAELDRFGRRVRDFEAGAERRALIERAKGVLMERHDVDERRAYEMLRGEARGTRATLADVADAVLRARALLRPPRAPPG